VLEADVAGAAQGGDGPSFLAWWQRTGGALSTRWKRGREAPDP